MKNKIIALSLLITAMSVVPAFGVTKDTCNNLDINKALSSNKIIQKNLDASQLKELLSSDLLKSKGIPSNILSLANGKISVSDLLKKLEVKTPEVKKPEVKAPVVTKPEQSTNTNTSVSSYEKQVADLVNAERAKAGVAPLTLTEVLETC